MMIVPAVWLLALLPARLLRAQEDIEIDFEPIGGGPGGDGGGIPMDAIQQLLGGGQGGGPPPGMFGDGQLIELGPQGPMGPMRGPSGPKSKDKSKDQAEAALDDMLADMFNAPPGAMKSGPSPKGKGKMTQKRLGDGTVIIEEDMPGDAPGNPLQQMMSQMMGGGDGPVQIMGGGPPAGVFPLDMRSTVPVSSLRDLFPGPHPQGSKDGPQPFSQPDPMIMGMMQDLDKAFTQNLLPTIQRASGVDRVPDSCKNEISRHCSGQVKSQLHCLGKFPEDISEPCKKDVGKSVPFLCSPAIDKFCDVLEKGILSCLGDHVQELNGPCKDAVVTTHHIIAKVNSQKASITNKATGAKTETNPISREALLDKMLSPVSKEKAAVPPPPPPAPSVPVKSTQVKQREAELDAKLAGLPPPRSLSLAQEDPDHFAMLREPATTFRHPAAPPSIMPHNPDVSEAGFAGYLFRALLFLGVVGLGAYVWLFTNIPLQMKQQFLNNDGFPVRKDDLELPRPGFL